MPRFTHYEVSRRGVVLYSPFSTALLSWRWLVVATVAASLFGLAIALGNMAMRCLVVGLTGLFVLLVRRTALRAPEWPPHLDGGAGGGVVVPRTPSPTLTAAERAERPGRAA